MAIDSHLRGNDDVAYGSFNVSKNSIRSHPHFLSRHTREGGYPLPRRDKCTPARGHIYQSNFRKFRATFFMPRVLIATVKISPFSTITTPPPISSCVTSFPTALICFVVRSGLRCVGATLYIGRAVYVRGAPP